MQLGPCAELVSVVSHLHLVGNEARERAAHLATHPKQTITAGMILTLHLFSVLSLKLPLVKLVMLGLEQVYLKLWFSHFY